MAQRKPLVLDSTGSVSELPTGDTVYLGNSVKVVMGTASLVLSLLGGATTDVVIPLNDAMPDTNYDVSATLVIALSLLGTTQVIHPVKTKTTTSVTFTLKNNGLALVAVSVTVIATAVRIG